MPVHPSRPLPEGWTPSREKCNALDAEFGHLVAIGTSLRRFRNHYAEGQTSRNWEAKFENWVLSDFERAKATHGTDDFGTPINQRKSKITAAQPGDPDYVDPSTL